VLEISADFDRLERALTDVALRQLPFATAMALNDTAKDVQEAEEQELVEELDKPTPFTRRGVYVQRASKRRLSARVGIKRIQAGYLNLQVTGGTRKPKGRALVVPVKARLNKYGNMPKGSVGRTAARKNTFVAGRGRSGTKHLRAGIYQRPAKSARSQSPKLLIAFEPRAKYKSRIKFRPVAADVARVRFPNHLPRRLKQALATAK